MSNIQKLIDRIRPANNESLRDLRLKELCNAAQKELDCLNSQALCLITTEATNSYEYEILI